MTEAEDTVSRASERSAFILALVVVMGVPREKNYFHMVRTSSPYNRESTPQHTHDLTPKTLPPAGRV